MSDEQKSKLPDFEEIKNMTTKFLSDVKKSVCEIYDEYQKKHTDVNTTEEKEAKTNEVKSEEVKTEKKPKPKEGTKSKDE